MARPVVSPIAEEVYAALGPLRDRDEETDYHLLRFVASVADLLQPVEDLIRDTDAGPGWSHLLDVDTAPVNALGWLGQFVGVQPLIGLAPASQRIRIREASGVKRGTLEAIRGAARQHLTGTRRVEIIERDGSPYRLTVAVYAAQGPTPTYGQLPDLAPTYGDLDEVYPLYGSVPSNAIIEAAVRAAKPAGLVMNFIVLTAATYASHLEAFPTYADRDAAFDTYADEATFIPE